MNAALDKNLATPEQVAWILSNGQRVNVRVTQDYMGFWQAYDDDKLDGAPDAAPQIVGIGRTYDAALDEFILLSEDSIHV